MEETLINNLENLIRAVKMGTKKPGDIAKELASNFTRLKVLNEGMHDELMGKYKAVITANTQK